jgi:hypothetical protein
MRRSDSPARRVILAEGYAVPVSEKDFDQTVNTASKPVLVDFGQTGAVRALCSLRCWMNSQLSTLTKCRS